MPRIKVFVCGIIAACAAMVMIAGLASERCLGDELYHWRFAKSFYLLGTRPAFDPVYGTGQPPGFFFNTEPLWHAGLAFTWKLSGGISAFIAQMYQAGYYALLLAATYLLTRTLYGNPAALFAAGLAASVPALAAFGILLYIDVAAAAWSTLCLFFIVRRRIMLAGLTLVLMYFTKRNACFFIPAYFLITIYLNRENVKRLLAAASAFCAPLAVAMPLDMAWREKHLILRVIADDTGKAMVGATIGTVAGLKTRLVSMSDWSLRTVEYLNSSFLQPADILKYFGVPLLLGLILYAALRKWQRRDAFILIPLSFYFIAFCYFFSPSSDIRYIIPAMPLLALLASRPFADLSAGKKAVAWSVALICAAQLIAVCLAVNRQRQVPNQAKEAFTYLKTRSSEKAIVVYPEYTVLEAAHRQFIWVGNMPVVMRTLFWSRDDAEVGDVLKSNGIEYVMIKKSRIYDDSAEKHYGGYPRSFVESLPSRGVFERVFDNEAVSIWRVK